MKLLNLNHDQDYISNLDTKLIIMYLCLLYFLTFDQIFQNSDHHFENSYLIAQVSNWGDSKAYGLIIKSSFQEKYFHQLVICIPI